MLFEESWAEILLFKNNPTNRFSSVDCQIYVEGEKYIIALVAWSKNIHSYKFETVLEIAIDFSVSQLNANIQIKFK